MIARLAALGWALTLLATTACGNDASEADTADPPPPPLQSAYEACEEVTTGLMEEFGDDARPVDELIRLEDDGQSLIVSTPEPAGEILSSIAFSVAGCVLEETDAPATIAEQMGRASALSGQEEDTYDGIDVTWAYSAGVNNGGFSATFETTD